MLIAVGHHPARLLVMFYTDPTNQQQGITNYYNRPQKNHN